MATSRNYASMMEELQRILGELQSSDIDVDEAFMKYERGQLLVSQLEAYLKTAANKIVRHDSGTIQKEE